MVKGTVPKSAEVDAWFEALDHPLKEAMLRVRRTILGADRRITETIKWKSPTFVFRGNIASIDPRTKKHVNLLFHQGASLPGKHPHLEGGGDTVRYMRFADLEDVRAKKSDLERAILAACELKRKGR
ncbi:MAG: DUF1801 domain-containing protein [Actinomycetota bacterium]